MTRTPATLLLVVAASVSLALAAELVLKDGRVISGLDVRRDGDLYVVSMESGNSFVVPAALVETVRLEGRGTPPAATSVPTGLTVTEPETLSGPPVRVPDTAEQTRALGEPARFQRDIIDSRWQPRSAFGNEDVLADGKARWAEDIVDNSWQPRSGFDGEAKPLTEARFQTGVVDTSWTPTDGFGSR